MSSFLENKNGDCKGTNQLFTFTLRIYTFDVMGPGGGGTKKSGMVE